jgi:hypothetical protein
VILIKVLVIGEGVRERERERVKKGEEKPSVCGELLGFVDLSAEIKERFF